MAKIHIPTSARSKKKARVGDGKINTIDEMVDEVEQELWKTNPMEALRYESVEKRKKLNWWARFSLSMIIVCTFLFLVWLLFFAALPQESRDLINIMVGAYVAVLAKTTDYWFKDKDDAEVKETEAIGNGNKELDGLEN
jgi:hypothetical protein